MVKRSSKCLEEVWERNFDNNGGGACGKGAPLNGCISKEIYLDKKEGTSFSILWFSPFFYVPWDGMDGGGCLSKKKGTHTARTHKLITHIYGVPQ